MSKPANRHTSETEAAAQGLTRRRALQAGAVAGTGMALAALGSSPAMAGTGRQSSTAPGPSPGWTAQWIGRNDPATRPALGQQAPAPLLRKGFNPGPVQYATTAVYDSFDVTRLLQPGQNTIGVMLGRSYFSATTSEGFGWGTRPDWHEPRLLAQLDIDYHDGSTARVVSDASWQLAGISAAAGFAKVLIRPAPPAGLDYAAASVATVRGLVASSWRRTGNELELTVEIPGNTTAQVDVPVSDGGSVQVSDTGGVSHRHTDGGYASYTAGSGQHRFVSVP